MSNGSQKQALKNYRQRLNKRGLAQFELMAEGTISGRPRNSLEMIIAAVAEANNCMVVTDNEKDFDGLRIVNPLRTAM